MNPYRKIIDDLGVLVKSKFNELFGNIQTNNKGWKTNKLRALATFKTGGTPSSKHPEHREGTIPFITPSSLGPDYIDETAARYRITEDAINSCATVLIPAGSLIIGIGVNVGKSSINTVDLCINQNVVSMMDINEKYEPLFLKHCVDQYIPYLDSKKRGATIKGITTELLKSIDIPEPPVEIQKAYVKFVKQIDKSKSIARQCAEKYDLLAKSRFIELFGNIQTNNKGWKTNKLGALATFKAGRTPPSKHPEYYEGTVPFITTPSLGPDYINETVAKYRITEGAINNHVAMLIPAGSLIIGKRISVGKSSINTVDLCTNEDIVSMMDINEKYEPLFLKHCVDQYIPYLDSQKVGATIKGITTEVLKSIDIPEPPVEIQKAYVKFVKQIDKW